MNNEVDNFLAHYGVRGMKWGKRSSSNNPSKSQLIKDDRKKARLELKDRDKELNAAIKERKATTKGTPQRLVADKKVSDADNRWAKTYYRATEKTRGENIATVAQLAGTAAVFAGARWAAKNPDKVAVFAQRAANTLKGTKALGVGYDVVQLAFKNGRWG